MTHYEVKQWIQDNVPAHLRKKGIAIFNDLQKGVVGEDKFYELYQLGVDSQKLTILELEAQLRAVNLVLKRTVIKFPTQWALPVTSFIIAVTYITSLLLR